MRVIDPPASASCWNAIRSQSCWLRWTPTSRWPRLERLARSLVLGARRELDLTPKPGLVDRHDNGSHPDLTYGRMRASVALLPAYYTDLLVRLRSEPPLGSCVEAGRLAEARMLDRVRANAHRGYIFLSGLALVGFHRAQGRLGQLPGAMAEAAREFFRAAPPEPSHGRRACQRFPVGGIRGEAEAGLPSVFETAWPRYADGLRRDGDWARAAFAAMAALMQRVEDTTALHRCGLDGLERLRRDGRDLETLLECGGDPRPFLQKRNEAYRRLNLTMGGVADCLALTMALHACFGGPPHLRTGEELRPWRTIRTDNGSTTRSLRIR